MIQAKILKDSLNNKGCRLTTFELTFPRFILAEFNTHRAISRVSASSRAIPVYKTLLKVIENPYIPTMEKNQAGMQSKVLIDNQDEATEIWLEARNQAVYQAYKLCQVNKKTAAEIEAWGRIESFLEECGFSLDVTHLNAHKQWVNRILEFCMYHTVIASATDWENLFALRTHRDTQPEFKELGFKMVKEYSESKPIKRKYHLPLVTKEENRNLCLTNRIKLCAARCARTSYLNHNGVRDLEEDYRLYDKLCESEPRHFSPLEFPAIAMDDTEYRGNFRGWMQIRKTIKNENIKEFNLPTQV